MEVTFTDLYWLNLQICFMNAFESWSVNWQVGDFEGKFLHSNIIDSV